MGPAWHGEDHNCGNISCYTSKSEVRKFTSIFFLSNCSAKTGGIAIAKNQLLKS